MPPRVVRSKTVLKRSPNATISASALADRGHKRLLIVVDEIRGISMPRFASVSRTLLVADGVRLADRILGVVALGFAALSRGSY